MPIKVFSLLLLFFVVGSSYSQELYIVSHPAANLSKNRIEFRNEVLGYGNFQYYHNSFDVNYGLLGNLTLYNKIFYTFENGYRFLGSYNFAARYRIHDKDKKNYHIRTAFQTGIVIPINPTKIVSDALEYELHPGHIIKFYNFQNDITVPLVDFHTTDNYTINTDFIVTNLIKKFAVTGEVGYNINIPNSDFKFGNYFDWNLAFGYLLFPREYKGYDDVNVNLYSEWKSYYFLPNYFLGQEIRNSGGFRLDTYTGIQTIFFSSLILELSYKTPVYSNEYAETKIGRRANALLISFRYLFFL